MDSFSRLLEGLGFSGSLCMRGLFAAPWCIGFSSAGEAPGAPAGKGSRLRMHVITEGRCSVAIPGHQAMEVQAGDALVFPHDHAHLMGSNLERLPVPALSLARPGMHGSLATIGTDGYLRSAAFVTGCFIAPLQGSRSALMDALPSMMKVRLFDTNECNWITEILKSAIRSGELLVPGEQALLKRHSEMLLLEAVRRYAVETETHTMERLNEITCPRIEKVLELMHGNPARSWTIGLLGGLAGMSRSVLAERFHRLVGKTPMQYLTLLRLSAAAQALEHGSEALARISERAGYDSVQSFARAFKREYGTAPATWRKRHKAAADGSGQQGKIAGNRPHQLRQFGRLGNGQ